MKIAIVGSAETWNEAPINDDTWRVWTISACFEKFRNMERMYELHDEETIHKEHEKKEGFLEFGNTLKDRFVTSRFIERYPEARVLDWQKWVKKHGKAPFSSSIAWMIAEAIDELENSNDEEKIIGLFGVHMASSAEYIHQKPGCRELIGWAKAKGIKVGVPKSCELMVNPYLYGVEEMPRAIQILHDKAKTMKDRKLQHEAQARDQERMAWKYEGAGEFAEFMCNNFFAGGS